MEYQYPNSLPLRWDNRYACPMQSSSLPWGRPNPGFPQGNLLPNMPFMGCPLLSHSPTPLLAHLGITSQITEAPGTQTMTAARFPSPPTSRFPSKIPKISSSCSTPRDPFLIPPSLCLGQSLPPSCHLLTATRQPLLQLAATGSLIATLPAQLD